MKFLFLFIGFALVACSNSTQKEKSENNSDTDLNTMLFEGKEFTMINDSTYQREEEEFQIILSLFPNGQVKSVEHQGEFQSCGTLVDTSRYFNEDGRLIKQIYHKNWMPEGADGCHSSVQDLHITEYFDNGKVEAKKLYRMGYQDLPQEAGIWKEFDENGELISTINFGDPYTAHDFLDIEFIEKLEENHGASYNQSILSKRGFGRFALNHDGDFAYINDENNKVITSANTFHGESVFTVEYYANRNRLRAFEEALKQMEGTYVYHGSSADAYFKSGLGTYRTKKVKIDHDKGLIVYTHTIGKELQLPPVELREL